MTSLETIWKNITTEACDKQILTGENAGHVHNSIIDGVYYRETAFAANIFNTEWLRTDNQAFKERSINAIAALEKSLRLCDENGLSEPYWTPRGVVYKNGSIPATVILWHALETAFGQNTFDLSGLENSIGKFLVRCHHGGGGFAHDAISSYTTKKIPKVINTSSMAYYFICARPSFCSSSLNSEIILKFICDSQRKDGLWPYISPNLMQKIAFRCKPAMRPLLLKVYNTYYADSSVFFGDYLHHVVTLYYLARAEEIRGQASDRSLDAMSKAIGFVMKNSNFDKEGKNAALLFDWEPNISIYRHCNMRDSSTYFYLLATLDTILRNNWLRHYPLSEFFGKLLIYIDKNLASRDVGGIAPYDGSKADTKFIMPRPAESIFDKGFLLAQVLGRSYE